MCFINSINEELEKKSTLPIPIIQKMTTDKVRDCLKMDLELNRLDGAIGKSIIPGRTNIPKKGDEDLIFGLSTNKLNSKLYKTHQLCKVADLFCPKSYEQFDLSKSEMRKQRTRDEVTELLKAVGLNYKKGMMEGIWQAAIRMEVQCPTEEVTKKTVNILSVISAIKQLEALPDDCVN